MIFRRSDSRSDGGWLSGFPDLLDSRLWNAWAIAATRLLRPDQKLNAN
ncbi:MAG: hypothetical protein GXY33_18365 [Phycisphaerae bacterium]|nr:hypothetical protein [Phycisphaerae bacterium]